MKRWVALMLIALVPVPAVAQERIFSSDAIRAALREMPAPVQFLDPRTDWDNVRRIPKSSPLVVYTRNSARKSQFVSADATGLTVIDVEASARPTLRIDRADVTEVSRVVGRKGSVAGAIAGAAAGFGLGLYAATRLAYKQCGGGCGDERLLMGLSLVGFPIGGAALGYALPGGNRGLEKIYIAP